MVGRHPFGMTVWYSERGGCLVHRGAWCYMAVDGVARWQWVGWQVGAVAWQWTLSAHSGGLVGWCWCEVAS